EGSSNGMPLSCTRMPGACPAIRIRARVEVTTTGRGSCGSGQFPAGVSRQIRQDRILRKISGNGVALSTRSGPGTRPGSNFRIPARDVLQRGWLLDPSRFHEIHTDKRRNIGKAVALPSDIATAGQFIIKKLKEPLGFRLVRLPPLGDARRFPVGHRRMKMAES